MKQVFSKAFMQDNCGCYKEEEGKLESMVLKGRDEITYQDILDSEITLKDKYWFFCSKVFTKEQNQHIAIQITECVLPIYEEKYPEDTRPRKAIEASKLYLSGQISLEQLLTAREAVADASRAAMDNEAIRVAAMDDEAIRVAAMADDAIKIAAIAAEAIRVAAMATNEVSAIRVAAMAAMAADCYAIADYTKQLESVLITFIENNK